MKAETDYKENQVTYARFTDTYLTIQQYTVSICSESLNFFNFSGIGVGENGLGEASMGFGLELRNRDR